MAALALLSLQDIAHGCGVSYKTVARWAKTDGWQPTIRANRTVGRAALYDFGQVAAAVSRRKRAA